MRLEVEKALCARGWKGKRKPCYPHSVYEYYVCLMSPPYSLRVPKRRHGQGLKDGGEEETNTKEEFKWLRIKYYCILLYFNLSIMQDSVKSPLWGRGDDRQGVSSEISAFLPSVSL